MTISYYPLLPSNNIVPSYQMTFDGATYLVTVTWNLFGQRYYINCFDDGGNRVFTVPIVETDTSVMLAGLTWDAATLSVTATASKPHGFIIGTIVQLTLADCSPEGYNGAYRANIISPNSFRFLLPDNPGSIQVLGTYSYLVSMCKGYFNSTLVYRNRQFEVSP